MSKQIFVHLSIEDRWGYHKVGFMIRWGETQHNGETGLHTALQSYNFSFLLSQTKCYITLLKV